MRAGARVATTGCLLLAVACRPEPARRVVAFTGPTMGTTWSVQIVPAAPGVSRDERTAVDAAIRDELARLNALMSTWDEASELSRFNASPSLEPFPVSADTLAVVQWASDIHRESAGALDITIAPLVDAWGFGTGDPSAQPPDERRMAALRGMVGMHLLELDTAHQTLRKQVPAVRCDVSALAPGYAADRLAEVLTARGFRDFLVDVGGEMVARGRNPDGRPWQIAVERPDVGRRAIERVVPLVDKAIATSGDYRNYREVNGKRLAHILDPRTGAPIDHALASATVIDDVAVRADGLATALMVLGPDEGWDLARRLDVAALLVVRNGAGSFDERPTPRFEALLEQKP